MSQGQNKIKVLVVTYFPWDDNLSTGNTLSNIFSGMNDNIEFANIFFKDGVPNNKLALKYFYVSEKKMIKSIWTRQQVGEDITGSLETMSRKNYTSSTYNKARKLRWEIFLIAQDSIGLLGNWKSKQLDKFVLDFSPDIIFGPLGRVPVSNNMMTYLKCKFNIPLILYPWDDHYSLRKCSISPFFWIKTYVERKSIRNCAKNSEFLYTITSKMQNEYSHYFNKKCKLLNKAYVFTEEPPMNKYVQEPIKIIYMGNIGAGRWKIISRVVKALDSINKEGKLADIYIYSSTPISEKVKSKLNIPGTSQLKNSVPNTEVLNIMKSADILLHVIPMNLKDRLQERLSFSTKIVDYFYCARCVLVVGGKTATTEYLRDNDAAIFVNKNIKITLQNVLSDKNLILEYGEKAWRCGVNKHQRIKSQDMIYSDFQQVLNENNK